MTQATQPRGTVHVVDPSPLNWLYVTYNTVEELVRVTPGGKVRPAAMRWYRWKDERTLDALVTEDRPGLHPAHRATHEVQIGPADRARGQTHDRVRRVLDPGFGDIVDTYVADGVKDDSPS